MDLNAYVVVRDAYSAWREGDLERFTRYLAPDIAFAVPSSSTTFVGTGTGRDTLKQRLQAFLDAYDVLEFTLMSAIPTEDGFDFRVNYHYSSKTNGLDIQGAQRHLWVVRGGLITSFTVVHDAGRLGAFFDLTSREFA